MPTSTAKDINKVAATGTKDLRVIATAKAAQLCPEGNENPGAEIRLLIILSTPVDGRGRLVSHFKKCTIIWLSIKTADMLRPALTIVGLEEKRHINAKETTTDNDPS